MYRGDLIQIRGWAVTAKDSPLGIGGCCSVLLPVEVLLHARKRQAPVDTILGNNKENTGSIERTRVTIGGGKVEPAYQYVLEFVVDIVADAGGSGGACERCYGHVALFRRKTTSTSRLDDFRNSTFRRRLQLTENVKLFRFSRSPCRARKCPSGIDGIDSSYQRLRACCVMYAYLRRYVDLRGDGRLGNPPHHLCDLRRARSKATWKTRATRREPEVVRGGGTNGE